MRYGFVTCVTLGQACIEELIGLDADLVLLGTLRDDQARNKSGRIYLDELASAHGIPMVKFRNVNDPDAVAALREARLDWLFIIGWSQIARAEVLRSPRLGVLGMHPTLLPQGRGRAAVPWAIIKGLEETGVTMFKLDLGMDTGPIVQQERIPITPDETSTTLYGKIVDGHRALIRETFPLLESGEPPTQIQDESQASEWPGRTPADGELDLGALHSAEVDRLVRALTRPYPGAFVITDDGSVIRIWSGHVGDGEGVTLSTKDGVYTATDYAIENG